MKEKGARRMSEQKKKMLRNVIEDLVAGGVRVDVTPGADNDGVKISATTPKGSRTFVLSIAELEPVLRAAFDGQENWDQEPGPKAVGILALLGDEAHRPPPPVDVYGDVLEQLYDGQTWSRSDQIPVQDALQRHGIVLMKETERAYIAGRTDEYKETKPRFPISQAAGKAQQ